jgi:hypothetical protein
VAVGGGEGAADGLATGVGEVPGAGVAEAAGAGVASGAGVAEAAGAGATEGLAVGEAEGAGDCASAAPPYAKTTNGISATMAERKVPIGFILAILHPSQASQHVPILSAKAPLSLTRKVRFVP